MTGAYENRVHAVAFALGLREEIERARQNGALTTQEIADDLNVRGVLTRRSGLWHRASINRVLQRLVLVEQAQPIAGEPEPSGEPELPMARGPYVSRGVRRRVVMGTGSGSEG